jgi:hypothetical protein
MENILTLTDHEQDLIKKALNFYVKECQQSTSETTIKTCDEMADLHDKIEYGVKS